LFRWKPAATVDLDLVSARLRTLVEGIAGARALTIGAGLGLSGPSGFDFGLTVDFDDEAAYQRYREHPLHQRLLTEVLVPSAETISAIQLPIAPAGRG
jgi:hypothetical protein